MHDKRDDPVRRGDVAKIALIRYNRKIESNVNQKFVRAGVRVTSCVHSQQVV